ncbi:GGDEF domain-containing protein [Candidatus Peregrinibacteria bacterium]|nr:GGDEF domain-containing protein [Candidatus Peregrinibacteria bacterium]
MKTENKVVSLVDVEEIKEQCSSGLFKFLNESPDISEIVLQKNNEGTQPLKEALIRILVRQYISYVVRNSEEFQQGGEAVSSLPEEIRAVVLNKAFIEEMRRVMKDQIINATKNAHAQIIREEELQTQILRHKTGLFNKVGHDLMLSREISLTTRENLPMSMLIFDIDKFKKVNSDYGHLAADEIINQIAGRIQSIVRDSDYASCWGGDEFAIILHNTNTEQAQIVAVRIAQAINGKPFTVPADEDYPGGDVCITVSIGGAEYTNKKEDPKGDKLFTKADFQGNILKGDQPDKEGNQTNRRGKICFDGEVMNEDRYRQILDGIERRSLTPSPYRPEIITED